MAPPHGLHTVRGRRSLAVARSLWQAREDFAREQDVAPGRLVPDRALVAAVLADPASKQALAGVKEFNGRASRSQLDRWWNAIVEGRETADLPADRVPSDTLPPPRAWADRNPDADRRLKAARPAVEARAEELRMPTENLLTPETLRRLAWAPPAEVTVQSVGAALAELGARPWQIDQTAQVIADSFVASLTRPRTLPPPIRRFGQPILRGRGGFLGWVIPNYGGRVAEMTDVFFVDGMRTPFGRAGEKGMYWNTRADDLVVKAIIGLMERNGDVPKDRIDDVAIAATSQTGDQGLTLGRTAAILAGLPMTVPGLAIERMCAGAMTSVTTMGASIGVGMYDLALAGGVEHMVATPSAATSTPTPASWPRSSSTRRAEHGRHRRAHPRPLPPPDQGARRPLRAASQPQSAGRVRGRQDPARPGSRRGEGADGAWGLATEDEGRRPRPPSRVFATLKTPFRPHGRVTAGTPSSAPHGRRDHHLLAGADA